MNMFATFINLGAIPDVCGWCRIKLPGLQVTLGYNNVGDRWAGASSPYSHPFPQTHARPSIYTFWLVLTDLWTDGRTKPLNSQGSHRVASPGQKKEHKICNHWSIIEMRKQLWTDAISKQTDRELFLPCMYKWIILTQTFLVACYATLHSALLVRPFVRPSVRLFFRVFAVFGHTAPAQMIKWPQK